MPTEMLSSGLGGQSLGGAQASPEHCKVEWVCSKCLLECDLTLVWSWVSCCECSPSSTQSELRQSISFHWVLSIGHQIINPAAVLLDPCWSTLEWQWCIQLHIWYQGHPQHIGIVAVKGIQLIVVCHFSRQCFSALLWIEPRALCMTKQVFYRWGIAPSLYMQIQQIINNNILYRI